MARLNRASMMCRATVSSGWPFFSYIASKKNGVMTRIISSIATLLVKTFRVRKYSGTPISAPPPKQINCRFVRLKKIFVLIFDKSLGTSA